MLRTKVASFQTWMEGIGKRIEFLPPLLVRISIGTVFMMTGWGKLHSLDKVTAFFTELGIPAPAFQAHLVATTEFLGGLLLILGLFTRFAAVPLAITMIVAILTAKRENIDGIATLFGFEEWSYLLFFFWLAVVGAGTISLDYVLVRYWVKRRT